MKSLIIRFALIVSLINVVHAQSPGGISGGLDVWHKADAGAYKDAGVTPAANGDVIRQWNDNAPTGFNVGQATAQYQPTFDDDAINYNPAFNFDGTDDYLFNTGFSLSGNTTNFIVASPVQDNSNDCLLNIASGTGGLWGYNALYLTTRDGGARLRFVYRNSPSQSGGNNLDAGSTLVYGQPSLMDFRRTQGGLQESWINTGDHQSVSASVSNYTGTSYAFNYGCLYVGTRVFGGKYGEHIKYATALNDVDKNLVDTYLAVKYGVTMSDDYNATTGQPIYSPSSYGNNIIGIGRDDVEALIQKQSHTIDDTTRIYLNTLHATNIGNTGSFASDVSYIVMGDNQGAIHNTAASNAEVPVGCGLYSRLEREWKVTKTNITEDFSWDITLSSGANPGSINVADLRLLVDDDGDFSNGVTNCYFNGDGTGVVLTYNNPTITISGISMGHIANNSTSYITIGSINGVSPLPVELIQFDVDCQKHTTEITWTTTSEINNNNFIIERSKDGFNFEEIGTVKGGGNSSTLLNYIWEDHSPLSGTVYYRLKQEDFNGEVEYHGVRTTTCKELGKINFYPNPFKNSINIQLSDNITYPITIEVLDYLGRKVHEETLQTSEVEISLNDQLPSGTYFVKVVNETTHVVERMVKMK